MRISWKHIVFLLCCLSWFATGCKHDSSGIGSGSLGDNDRIIVLADTFAFVSGIDTCESILSQADSFLLGEIETDYGLLRATILTQLACPEGYSYPDGAEIDSICLLMAYRSWVGDSRSPIILDAYQMDKGTFNYSSTYRTDISIEDYCSRDKELLRNKRIVVAEEKLDSVMDSDGNYMPMLRMRLNDDFVSRFAAIQSFANQNDFNKQFNGLLLETAFGSATVLNISDIAMGVYYHFTYNRAGKDTTVNDMKAFYANSEVRTINSIQYADKGGLAEELRKDSDAHDYIVAPAGIYTRMSFPMGAIVDSMRSNLYIGDNEDGSPRYKRPYVNLARLRVEIDNVYSGSSKDMTRNDWIQPAQYMLLVKESRMESFFENKELPTDTCALLSSVIQGVDSVGNNIYYYEYDMSDLLTQQLRQDSLPSVLDMMLVPVSVTTLSSATGVTTAVSAVRQQQTISATKIASAKSGQTLKLVYSGF